MSSIHQRILSKTPTLSQIVPVLAILMEVFWTYAWLLWLSRWKALHWEQTPLNLISCIFLALTVEMLSRLTQSRKWSLRRIRLVVLSSSGFLLLVLVRLNQGGGYAIRETEWVYYAVSNLSPLIASLIFGVYLIWRGLSVGALPNTFGVLYRRFLLGLAALVLLLIIWGKTGGAIKNIWFDAGIYTILFFGVGLLSLALSNLETLGSELVQHQETDVSFSRRWLFMLVVLILGILGVAIVVAGIFSTDIAATLLQALGLFGKWLSTSLLYLLYPLAFLAAGLFYLAKLIISLITGGKPPPPFEVNLEPILIESARRGFTIHIPKAVLLALKWGLVAFAIFLVIFFLSRIITRRSGRKADEEVEEVHETIFSWNLFSADLRAILAWLFRWARRGDKDRKGDSIKEYKAPWIEKDTGRIYDIREIYRAWLWQAHQKGSPRRLSETPYEFHRRLGPEVENIAGELDEITEAYIGERYGHEKTGVEKLKILNHRWSSLKAKLNNPEIG